MGRDIPLGRIAGIKLSMNWSVLLVAGLYAWVLADNRLPIQSPGQPANLYWVAGVAGALLFFVSLLVHEMGHALVARDEGIGVRGISLWLLGGVAKLESSPQTPAAEFKIAVVGPLASAACGAVFLTAAYLLPDQGVAGLAGHTLAWLGYLNLLLAAFNILPAAPLDGGTVLSAAVWWRTRSQTKGMRWAAVSGVITGTAMALAGIASMRDESDGDMGIWIIAVGGFIALNALERLRAAPMFKLLEGTQVHHAMNPEPPTAQGWLSVAEFLRTLPRETAHQAYPVVDQQGLVAGLLTANAIRSVPSEQWSALMVSQLSFPLDRLTIVRTDEPLLAAVQRVDGGEIRTGLVVDPDGRIVGTVDAAGLYATAEARKIELAAATLPT